jgi:hypothetical protein
MNIGSAFRIILAAACFITASCDKGVVEKSKIPFRIIATDSGFDAPDHVAAGFRHIIFENRGSEIHEAMLVKLPGGMSASDYVAAVKRGSLFPEGALDYSGPGLTSPGETAEMWVKVDPGQYVLICWNDDHARTRSAHSFSVDYTVVDDKAPKEDAVLKLVDYKFELEGNLQKGEQVIRVETPGPAMHEADIFRLHEGKTVDDLRRWRKEDHPGPAPADALGGVLDNHDIKRIVWLRKNFSPGRYAFHCEMPLTTGASATSESTTHADLGMVREFEIKE